MTDADHPRPDFIRDRRWESLDGSWDFALGAACPAAGAGWGTIVVPYPWESAASGVRRGWSEHGWYRRVIDLPEVGADETLILHVGAAHYTTVVLVDRRPVAEHTGGMTPFEADLSGYAGRRVELVIGVHAPIDKRDIPHGKQRSVPADPYDVCSFTPCSGIWQSVWLECRPRTFLRSARLVPDRRLDRFQVQVAVHGPAAAGSRVTATVLGSGETTSLPAGGVAALVLDRPRPWSPADPQLYRVRLDVTGGGRVLDSVTCTTGLRSVEVAGAHLLLNGKRVFLRGVLDQGYWPGAGWASPDATAFARDLQAARDAGFTLVRKHLKLEDPRWLHAADTTGMLVWEEPPSTSRFSGAAVDAFEDQLAPMVERDVNHPSIIVWGLYNEEWGLDWDVPGDPAKQAVLDRAYHRLRALDASRPIVDNSGWAHVRTDLVDWHVYAADHTEWRATLSDLDSGFTVQLGPGGRVRKQIMADGSARAGAAGLNSEYGTGTTSVERAWVMRWQTQEMRRMPDLNGYVYCELYDIEHETAGVLTAHRQPKDSLALRPGDTHADTVIILDLTPTAPGCDLLATDRRARLQCLVSTHTGSPRQLRLEAGWGPPLSEEPPASAGVVLGEVKVWPFVVSEPVTVALDLPDRAEAARLHLWLTDPLTGTVEARAPLDVRTSPDGRSL